MAGTLGIDHITLCVPDLGAAEFLFNQVLGFHTIWSAQDVGTEKSSMDTIVVQRDSIKVALMQGNDKQEKSQITDFVERYGPGVQHVAIEVDDIEAVSNEWEDQGVKFSGPIKEGKDGFGPLRQRFTCPLFPGSGVFFELTQRQHGEETSRTFVKGTVESLYRDIEKQQSAGVGDTIIDYSRQHQCVDNEK